MAAPQDQANVTYNNVASPVLDGVSFEAIKNEVLFLNNLKNMNHSQVMRTEYNTIVYCRGGRILVEVGGNSQVKVHQGQLLLIPAQKTVQPMMVSTDVDAGVLLISDRILRSVLGNQIGIWNKAIYMNEIYVINESGWTTSVQSYTKVIFNRDYRHLRREIMLSFLRTFLLIMCEELLRHDTSFVTESLNSTSHEKELFNKFLDMISFESQKRQLVSYYANKLNITPKYLSIVCKRVSGKNPLRWITDSVMEDCYKLLLDTDLTIKEISARLGFPNPSFFGQYFREQAGVTPMEYRIEHKKMS